MSRTAAGRTARPGPRVNGGARWRTAALVLAGLAATGAVAAWAGVGDVARILAGAGWALAPLAGAHGVSLWLDAAAWAVLAPEPRPRVPTFLAARWVRESVNALLPAAQIGGEAVAVRLLARAGAGVGWQGAVVALDLATEFASMVVLGAVAAAVLLADVAPARRGEAVAVALAMLPPAAVALAFLVGQRFGLLGALARRLDGRWPGLASGLRDAQVAATAVWDRPAAVLASVGLHALGWLSGAVETWVALIALGHALPLDRAFALEGTTEVLRAFGFAVPGTLGIQEGSLIVVGGLLGLAPAEAVALSLFRRARDVAVGLPALGAWWFWDGRRRRTAEANEPGRGAQPPGEREG